MKQDNKDIGSTGDKRIIDRTLAEGLMAAGWSAADLHVHTMFSYDVIPTREVDPLVLYDKARQAGLTHVAFTDHDTMDAYDRIGWTRPGIITAVEIKINDPRNVGHTVHTNIYGLDRDQFREALDIAGRSRNIYLLADYLKSEGLVFMYNHPFWHEPGERMNLAAVAEIAGLFPIIEYNMGRVRRLNQQAAALASLKRKGLAAGTDSHVGDIGRAFTTAEGRDAPEFMRNIAAGKGAIVPADLTGPGLKKEAAVRIRSLFDKGSWVLAKNGLTVDTGIALLDGLVGKVARSGKGGGTAGHLVQAALEAAAGTGIPGYLYIRSQDGLASRIGRFMKGLTSAA